MDRESPIRTGHGRVRGRDPTIQDDGRAVPRRPSRERAHRDRRRGWAHRAGRGRDGRDRCVRAVRSRHSRPSRPRPARDRHRSVGRGGGVDRARAGRLQPARPCERAYFRRPHDGGGRTPGDHHLARQELLVHGRRAGRDRRHVRARVRRLAVPAGSARFGGEGGPVRHTGRRVLARVDGWRHGRRWWAAGRPTRQTSRGTRLLSTPRGRLCARQHGRSPSARHPADRAKDGRRPHLGRCADARGCRSRAAARIPAG